MAYTLIIGDYAYSSWSLRGWLLLEKFGIPYTEHLIDFSKQDGSGLINQMIDFAPAKTVPTLVTQEGIPISDSLAMAEELASRHPEAGIWPTDPKARAVARTLACEMHSGFTALRTDCPMNLRTAYADCTPSQQVMKDLDRLQTIWEWARETCAPKGPWLCGAYSAADAFFAPVAARIAGYSLPVNTMAQDYVKAHLTDPAFKKWRALGLTQGETLPWYKLDHPTKDWPT